MTEVEVEKTKIAVANDFLKQLKQLTSDSIILCNDQPLKPGLTNFQVFSGAVQIDLTRNCYYTINPRDSINTNGNGKIIGQGRKDQIRKVIAFYADVEAGQAGHKKASHYATKEEALAAINSFIVRPSTIIDSGHGFHCLWFFTRAHTIGEEISLERYEAINRGIQRALKADDTADVSRLLRLPGSLNVKDPENPIPVTIVDDSGLRYDIEDFSCITPIDDSKESAAMNLNLSPVKVNRKRLSPRINGMIKDCIDSREPENTDRSAMIQAVVSAMVAADYSDNEIYSVLTDSSLKISEKILTEKKSDADRKRYVALSITKAKALIASQKEEEEDRLHSLKSKLTILGYTKEHKVLFWKQGTIMEFELKKLCMDNLCLLTDISDIDKQTFSGLKTYVREECNRKGLIKDSDKLRNGIWKAGDEFIIISGIDVLKVKDGTITRLDEPVINGRVVEFEDSWLDTSLLEEVFSTASLDNVYHKLVDYVNFWNWEEPEMVPFVASFVMLSAFQQSMKWRPWIHIQAKAGSGKSLFFESVLQLIYGPLAIRLDEATPFAAAQNLDRTGKIALFDNFEPTKRREHLLEMFQPSSRGTGVVPRGTTGDKAKNMKIHHMLWFNSVISTANTNASDTRIVLLRLRPMEKIVSILSTPAAERLKTEIIAAMIKNWKAIEEKASGYIEEYRERQVENIAYAMAIQELVSGEAVPVPEFVSSKEIVNEGECLLDAIMRARTIPDGNQDYESSREPAHKLLLRGASMESKGIKIVIKRPGDSLLALHIPTIKRNLLSDMPEYRDLSSRHMEEMLLNLEGAEKQKQKLNRLSVYVVTLPDSYLEDYKEL